MMLLHWKAQPLSNYGSKASPAVVLALIVTLVVNYQATAEIKESAKELPRLPRILPLPTNIGLREYFDLKLWKELKYLTAYPILVDKELKGTMFSELRQEEKKTTARLFGFNAKKTQEAAEILKELTGKRIRFDRNETLVESTNNPNQLTKWNKDPYFEEKYEGTKGRSMQGRLVVLANYENHKYLILKGGFTKDSLWFFPLNKRSIRYLGHFFDEGFCDKNYHEYYSSYADQEIKSKKPLGTLIWETILKGYDQQEFASHTRGEQKLIHDTVGIFLSEEFRLKSMGKQDELSQIMPGAIFIATFILGNGEPYGKERNHTKPKKIHHIPISYRELKYVFDYYDRTISDYIKKNDPSLYKELLKEVAKTNPKNKTPKPLEPPILKNLAKLSRTKQSAAETENTLETINKLLIVIKTSAHKMTPQRDNGHLKQK
jgi:hypothetical protein